RDLARFALLYLHKGWWRDRRIIPAPWVDESTRAYSNSEWGPGYGYLWWTGPINNGVVPSVNLPDGTFFAQGAGGQFAFVIPGQHLIVVHRAVHSEGEVSLRAIGRPLWLILDAGRFPNIGPDASLEAVQQPLASGEALSQALTGKSLLYGEGTMGGPYRFRLNADGTTIFL